MRSQRDTHLYNFRKLTRQSKDARSTNEAQCASLIASYVLGSPRPVPPHSHDARHFDQHDCADHDRGADPLHRAQSLAEDDRGQQDTEQRLGIAEHGGADRTEITKRGEGAQQPHRDADAGCGDAEPSRRIHRP